MKFSKSDNINQALKKMGINNYVDVLNHLPRRYESFAYTPRKNVYENKERIVVLGRVRGKPARPVRFSHRTLHKFYFETTAGEVFSVEAWNRDYLGKFLVEGELYTLSGSYDKKRGVLSLINIVKGQIDQENAIKPVYSLPSDIENRSFASLVKKALDSCLGISSYVPFSLQRKYRLEPLKMAYEHVHFPKSYEDIHAGMRVFKYQEALMFELSNQLVRGANKSLRKPRNRLVDREKMLKFIDSLPYKVGNDQMEAFNACLEDMDSPTVMYRLLQGDVGTGKTLVASLCAYANHLRSEQTAFLAPTDTLARQHYETLKKLFEGTNVEIGLLVGHMDAYEKRNVLQDLEDGTLDMVVGTHALFSKSVNYAYLGLVIIDEQHKFGVNQRAQLVGKGEHADLLLMSATPIPRTLTLTIYGDLDVSTLHEFPAGKRNVKTYNMKSDDSKLLKRIVQSVDGGKRVFIVVPQIEGKDEETSVLDIYEKYRKLFPNKVALIHGRVSEEDKEAATLAFKTGLCPILVATSVIEVGIDVKNSDLMVIYSPSHFSLSSLHQLRGRVGRDGTPSECILLSDLSDEDEKLKILMETDDGFKIAEEDLRLRGPGDIAGVRQSGLPEFSFANIIDDFKIFEIARDDATLILKNRMASENLEIIELAKEKALLSTLS
ncbi:MAG: ATP-dependent DNA helicase RecG [Bacilli bacterium]|nr:ATP-dependent DNA helicase RecG [Bacilli bacterium]